VTVETAQIKTFAAEFDPQPFHLDEEAPRHDLPGPRCERLAHRGSHDAPAGPGELAPAGALWRRLRRAPLAAPVRPGDELRVESEVLEVRPSRSRPDQG